MSTEKQIFRDHDRVYINPIGWGKVIGITPHDISIEFDIGGIRHISGDVRKLLSFTEYTLEGFSQERPEELPNVGDIVWVRNGNTGNWGIGHFYKKTSNYYCVSDYVGQNEWSRSGIEMTTKNPYENKNVNNI